jgi:PAS domain S-box-containing protein
VRADSPEPWRKELERALDASERRFRTFLDLSAEGIARFELDEPLPVDRPPEEQVEHILRSARLVECNAALLTMLRRADANSVMGLRLADLAPIPEISEDLGLFVRQGHRLVEHEGRRTRPDGSVVWALANAVGLIEDGCLRGLWIAQQEITERKQGEEDLRARGRILEAVAFCTARLLEPGRWEDQAAEALARLAEAVVVGHAYLFENFGVGEDAGARLVEDWAAPGVPRLRDDPRVARIRWGATRSLADGRRRFEAGQSLCAVVSEMEDAPLLRLLGLRSVLMVPVFVGVRWWGMLGFGEFQYDRRWSTAEIEALSTAARCIGAALMRQHSERALRESEERFARLAVASFEGIAITEGGRFVDANEQLARMLRCGVDDLVGRPALDFVAEADRELVASHILASSEEPYSHLARRLDGTVFPVEVRAKSTSHRGRSARVTALRDISERIQAEEALRSSEERYRLLFEGNPLPMFIYDLDTLQFLAANQAAVEQYGHPREELLQLSVPDLALPGDENLAHFLATRHDSRPNLVRVGLRQQRRKDGSIVDVDMTSLALQFGGRSARLVLARDVTAERQAELERERLHSALERAAAEWHRTFDAVETCLLLLDKHGVVRRVNRAARQLLGGEYKDLLGRHIRELGSAQPWQAATESAETTLATGAPASAQAHDPAAGRTWDLTAYPSEARGDGEDRTILVIRDVTRLLALQDSLRRSETMSAMGSLVAGVAHEVRNPLFSISATIDALESELPQEHSEYAALLRSQVGRLTQLMRDLLDYGKPTALKRLPARPAELLRRALRACATLARDRNVTFVEDVAADVPALDVDASRMEQVFENLLANAIQHSPAAGRIHVTVRRAPQDAARVEFKIEDEGPGVPSADLPRLFEPFFSRRKGGTGLGLSVVQRIVEAHGGSVTASDRIGGGAAFSVLLPAPSAGPAEGAGA